MPENQGNMIFAFEVMEITQKLFFQINNGTPAAFGQVTDNEPFTMKVGSYATKEEIEELKKSGAQWSLIEFKDKEGNVFKIFNQPID
jgi:hypothetical protein